MSGQGQRIEKVASESCGGCKHWAQTRTLWRGKRTARGECRAEPPRGEKALGNNTYPQTCLLTPKCRLWEKAEESAWHRFEPLTNRPKEDKT